MTKTTSQKVLSRLVGHAFRSPTWSRRCACYLQTDAMRHCRLSDAACHRTITHTKLSCEPQEIIKRVSESGQNSTWLEMRLSAISLKRALSSPPCQFTWSSTLVLSRIEPGARVLGKLRKVTQHFMGPNVFGILLAPHDKLALVEQETLLFSQPSEGVG